MKRVRVFAIPVTILFIAIGCRSKETGPSMTDSATLQKSTHTAPTLVVSATPLPSATETPSPTETSISYSTPVTSTIPPVAPYELPVLSTITSTPRQSEATATSIPTPIAESTYDGLRVTYIWNAGFLITAGDKRILIDAIYEGHPGGILKPILESQPPFDGVDLILATHEHVDHFSPSLVRQYMLENSNTVFASTQSAVQQLLALGDDLQSRVISIDLRKGESEYFESNGIAVEAIIPISRQSGFPQPGIRHHDQGCNPLPYRRSRP